MRKFIKSSIIFSLVSWVVGWVLVGFIKSDLTGDSWTEDHRFAFVTIWVIVVVGGIFMMRVMMEDEI